MNETTAIQSIVGQVLPARPPTIIRPIATADEALAAWQDFQALKAALISADDVQGIAGKQFIKKAGWRKIAAAFGISLERTAEERDQLPNQQWLWRVTARATAPNGRYAEGTAACASNERRFAHPEHDSYAMAYTRAANRAISDLVGGGEVSAEEMRAEQTAARPPDISREQAEALTGKFLDSTEPWYVPPAELIGAVVMAHGDLRQAYRLLAVRYADTANEVQAAEEPPDDE